MFKGMLKTKNLMYYLLTAVSFYLVAYVIPIPSLGAMPETYVRALVFVAVHMLTHRVKKAF
jgi:hypothetical protein